MASIPTGSDPPPARIALADDAAAWVGAEGVGPAGIAFCLTKAKPPSWLRSTSYTGRPVAIDKFLIADNGPMV
jgi:hypothetical protein